MGIMQRTILIPCLSQCFPSWEKEFSFTQLGNEGVMRSVQGRQNHQAFMKPAPRGLGCLPSCRRRPIKVCKNMVFDQFRVMSETEGRWRAQSREPQAIIAAGIILP